MYRIISLPILATCAINNNPTVTESIDNFVAIEVMCDNQVEESGFSIGTSCKNENILLKCIGETRHVRLTVVIFYTVKGICDWRIVPYYNNLFLGQYFC